ncbi:cysteine synthase A [Mycoplasmatota bacterium]|nr:cysteine synthase A [Mycoplasmatota bacterium]
MMYKNIIEMIGNTPCVNIKNLNKEIKDLYLKLEGKNPGGSVKDRTVLGMILDAENKGLINNESVLIEPTSGNTGISLAMIGSVKGYKVILVMPDTMSIERRNIIKSYGAELILTEGSLGMKGSIEKSKELLKQNNNYYMLSQFDNASNWKFHYETTGKEIINDMPDIDILVAGVGTGGTISGTAKRLKEYNKDILVVAVEPRSSAVLSGQKAGPHKIQGIGAGFVPNNYKSEFVDNVITISNEEAFETTKKLLKHEGLFVGISTGANVSGAIKAIKKYGIDKKVMVISPDNGDKYLSTGVFN